MPGMSMTALRRTLFGWSRITIAMLAVLAVSGFVLVSATNPARAAVRTETSSAARSGQGFVPARPGFLVGCAPPPVTCSRGGRPVGVRPATMASGRPSTGGHRTSPADAGSRDMYELPPGTARRQLVAAIVPWESTALRLSGEVPSNPWHALIG